MDPIISFLDRQLPRFLSDLGSLVNIDSGSHNKAGVDTVGRLARAKFRGIGCEITEFPVDDYGDCFMATLKGSGQARVLLIGHLDTVYPDGTAAQRPLRFEGGRAYGPGVTDMKAGILAGLHAMAALHATGFTDFAELSFFANTDEEVGSPISRDLYRQPALQSDAVLVLEAARANGDIVSARKGGGTYYLTVRGRAAHAGVEPEKGANAILELAHQVVALQALNGLSPGTTVNVGVIQGGTRSNVVPEEATAEIDVRFVTRQAMEELDRAIRGQVAHTTVPGTRIKLRGNHKGPMERTTAIGLLVELAQQAAHQLGFEIRDTSTGGTSDANFTAALGIPTLDGLGPIGGADHSPGEYLELNSIVPRTALLAKLIMLICRERERLLQAREANP